MTGASLTRRAIFCGLMLGCAPAALAQNRTEDNAITQAEDAFGFRVGRESIGIYNAGNTRGFSPTSAGNLRIDGLYFDPAFGLQGLLVDQVSIKVGLSAQGYPFAAPSGNKVETAASAVPALNSGVSASSSTSRTAVFPA